MTRQVNIIEETQGYKKAIFRIIEAKLRHEKYDGSMSTEITRLSLERGDGVAAIIHNPDDDTILMIEQFRYPTYRKTKNGWIKELPAGIVEEGEDPADTMKREIEEETGYAVDKLKHLYTFFLSPGGSSERIFLYYGRLDPNKKVNEGGGLDTESEDILTTHIKVDDALKKMSEQVFEDAKTILALQWLAMNRENLNQLDTDADATIVSKSQLKSKDVQPTKTDQKPDASI